MAYQEGLKSTKKFLKESPEKDIRDLCAAAGLTAKETEMMVQRFRKGKTRLHASYDLGMCESSHSTKTTQILNIIKKVLVSTGFIDD